MTNPPIDPLREKLVTSTRAMIGPEGDVTDMGHEGHAARLELIQPFLKPEELQAFKHMDYRGWRAKVCHLHTIQGQGNLRIPNAWLGLCVHSIGCSFSCKHDAAFFLLSKSCSFKGGETGKFLFATSRNMAFCCCEYLLLL